MYQGLQQELRGLYAHRPQSPAPRPGNAPSQPSPSTHRFDLKVTSEGCSTCAAALQKAVAMQLRQGRGREPTPSVQAIHILTDKVLKFAGAMQGQQSLHDGRKGAQPARERAGRAASQLYTETGRASNRACNHPSTHLMCQRWRSIGKFNCGFWEGPSQLLRRPDTVWTPEVRDARAGADPSPCEGDDAPCLRHLQGLLGASAITQRTQ